MATANPNGVKTNQTETLVIVGAAALALYFLKDAFKGFGSGFSGLGSGLGAGLGGLGSGLGTGLSQIGNGIDTGLADITGLVPSITSGLGGTGSAIGSALNATGGLLASISHDIDLTDPSKYRWVAPTVNTVTKSVTNFFGSLF